MPGKWTRKQAERFIGDSFRDRIAWVAARTILVGITNDEGYKALSEGNRTRIEAFLARNPAPKIGGQE